MFSGKSSAFLTKLSPQGDAIIYSTSLSIETTIGTGVSLDPSGNAYVAGTFCSPCSETAPTLAFVAKVSPEGKLTFLKFLAGSDGSSSANAIAIDAEGEYVRRGEYILDNVPRRTANHSEPHCGLLGENG